MDRGDWWTTVHEVMRVEHTQTPNILERNWGSRMRKGPFPWRFLHTVQQCEKVYNICQNSHN